MADSGREGEITARMGRMRSLAFLNSLLGSFGLLPLSVDSVESPGFGPAVVRIDLPSFNCEHRLIQREAECLLISMYF